MTVENSRKIFLNVHKLYQDFEKGREINIIQLVFPVTVVAIDAPFDHS